MTSPDVIGALDPGGTTGVRWWEKRNDGWGHAEVAHCDSDEGLKQLLDGLTAITALAVPFIRPRQVHIIYERFEHRPDEKDRFKIDYTPAEVIGAIRTWALDRQHVKLVKQSASQAKAFWTDDKIKRLHLWVPGHKHTMDATRHLLWYRAFGLREMELMLPFAPLELSEVPLHNTQLQEDVEFINRMGHNLRMW